MLKTLKVSTLDSDPISSEWSVLVSDYQKRCQDDYVFELSLWTTRMNPFLKTLSVLGVCRAPWDFSQKTHKRENISPERKRLRFQEAPKLREIRRHSSEGKTRPA